MGIEPTSRPWEGCILPMNYTRTRYASIIAEETADFNHNLPPHLDKKPRSTWLRGGFYSMMLPSGLNSGSFSR